MNMQDVSEAEAAQQQCPVYVDAAVGLPTKVCRLTGFLGEQISAALLERAIRAAEGPLTPAPVGPDWQVMPSVRRSQLDMGFAVPELLSAIDGVVETVERILGVSCRDTKPCYSLNVYGEGDFFVPHQDSWDTFHPERVVTFVYYLHRTPRSFEGGALRVFDTSVPLRVDGRMPAWEERTWRDYPPEHDSIVFFHPGSWHEARPVHCPTQDKQDSRFAINGWLARRPSV
ncbi:2OG-Fe(II) oxygenase [Streptomyces sp. NPDC059076]|uniref:2OG-Fe(II) oxygenase n=1 Tax=unclassified Streptomyces TaxID=2593676 RepID=UPI003678E03A